MANGEIARNSGVHLERSRFSSREERAATRNGPVGAIPNNAHWQRFERWRIGREAAGATYYRVANDHGVASPARRAHVVDATAS